MMSLPWVILGWLSQTLGATSTYLTNEELKARWLLPAGCWTAEKRLPPPLVMGGVVVEYVVTKS